VSTATPRVFAIFLIGGTSLACLMLWATERLLLLAQNPPLSYDDALPMGLFGALVLSCVWVLPGQAVVAILASFFFSFFKRIPVWFVLSVLVPVCALIVTYRDISDRHDAIQKSDYRKLLYWLLIITPGELLCARVVSRQFGSPSQALRVGDVP
jgi:hypothetical protein